MIVLMGPGGAAAPARTLRPAHARWRFLVRGAASADAAVRPGRDGLCVTFG